MSWMLLASVHQPLPQLQLQPMCMQVSVTPSFFAWVGKPWLGMNIAAEALRCPA